MSCCCHLALAPTPAAAFPLQIASFLQLSSSQPPKENNEGLIFCSSPPFLRMLPCLLQYLGPGRGHVKCSLREAPVDATLQEERDEVVTCLDPALLYK